MLIYGTRVAKVTYIMVGCGGAWTRPERDAWRGVIGCKCRRRCCGAGAVIDMRAFWRHGLRQEGAERSSAVSPVAVNCGLKFSWRGQLFLWTFIRIKIFHVSIGQKEKEIIVDDNYARENTITETIQKLTIISYNDPKLYCTIQEDSFSRLENSPKNKFLTLNSWRVLN